MNKAFHLARPQSIRACSILAILLLAILISGFSVIFAYADTASEGSASGTASTEASVNNDDAEDVVSYPVNKPTKAGWMKDADGSWYYFTSATANPSTGWIKLRKTWYYLDPAENGKMATGLLNDGKANYIASATGAMQANKWVKLGTDWYFATKSGALKTGWLKSGGKWYWLQADKQGLMAKNQWITDKNKLYFLTNSGAMKTGWVKDGYDWYYTNKSGARQTNGWVKSSGKWYWLQGDLQGAEKGKMAASAIKTIENKLYAFDSSGAMRANTAVDLEDNKVGYAASSGAITQIGIKQDGKTILQDAQGKTLTGWQKLSGVWFYGDEGGVAHTGWLELGSKWYWMDASGVMATGLRKIDGKNYIFSANGTWLPVKAEHAAVFERAIKELEKCTNSSMTKEQKLRAAFNHIRDDFLEKNPRIPHMKAFGWETIYANDIFIGRYGNCISMAAAFAFMAKAIGYQNVYACNYGHAWCEIDGRIYDPEWEKNHRSESYYNRAINAPGGPGYTNKVPAGKPWARIAI